MKEESTYKHCFWVLVAAIVLALVMLSTKSKNISIVQVESSIAMSGSNTQQ